MNTKHVFYPLENILRRISWECVDGWEPFEICRVLHETGGVELVLDQYGLDGCGITRPSAYIPSRRNLMTLGKVINGTLLLYQTSHYFPSIWKDGNFIVRENPSDLVFPQTRNDSALKVKMAIFLLNDMCDGAFLVDEQTDERFKIPSFSSSIELDIKLRLFGRNLPWL